MKSILGQGQVQATNNLGANGGVLGAMVGMYAKKKDYETRFAYQTSLMEFDDKLKERRQLTGTVHNIVADQARQATAHHYKTAQEAAKAKSELKKIKIGAEEKRKNLSHEYDTGLEITKKMTAGLETSAGLPLSGGISPLVAGPNQYQGQLQAFKHEGTFHPHMGMVNNPAQTAAETPTVTKPDTSNPITPAAAKGGRTRTKPFADPSVEKNVKPVPSEVASPFSAPDTRTAIFADASAPKVDTPAAETPAARIKKA